jgi:hypothetical protein
VSQIGQYSFQPIRVGLLIWRTLKGVMTPLFGSSTFLTCPRCSLAAGKGRSVRFPNNLHREEIQNERNVMKQVMVGE